MNWKTKILKLVFRIKSLITRKKIKRNEMKRRRESVASVYRKTTKFLSSNTAFLMKKMPNRRYRLLTKKDDFGQSEDQNENSEELTEDDIDFGERDLDYYLGVRTKETYWRDPEGKEQIRKDFLVYHCGVTLEEYEKLYKKTVPKSTYVTQPRLKQVPFRIHRKKRNSQLKREGESWCEKTGIFKLFIRRESEYSTSSDSYSECESDDKGNETKDFISVMTKGFSSLSLGDNEVYHEQRWIDLFVTNRVVSYFVFFVPRVSG